VAGNAEYYRITNDNGLLLSRRYFNQRLSQATEDDRREEAGLRHYADLNDSKPRQTIELRHGKRKRRLHYLGRSEDSLKPNEIIDPIQLTGIKTIRFYASRNLTRQVEEIKKS